MMWFATNGGRGCRMALPALAVWVLAGSLACVETHPAGGGAVALDADDIGGVVSGANGPEAGVWVIAETDALPTKFIRIVVADEQGRYLLPDMPDASFDVFVRGYGLVDSPRVEARPGQQLNLVAAAAADARAAAHVYPANEWLSLAVIPEGPLDTQQVVSTIKACMACHQIGDESTRRIPESLDTFDSHLEAWDRRVQSGQWGSRMSGEFMRLGPQRTVFPDWTDRIAAGEVPIAAPSRPAGVERNVVITMWDWGRPTSYVHDASPGDKRDPTFNANGLVYGAVQSDDLLVWVDPAAHTAGEIEVSTRDVLSGGRFGAVANVAPSPFWGDEVLWTGVAQPRNPMGDHTGRMWVSVAIRSAQNQPAYCGEGSTNVFAQYFPLDRGFKQIAVYDPQTEQWAYLDTCFPTEHFDFAEDSDDTVFTSSSVGDVVSWVAMRVYDETNDTQAAQGWCPAVLDTNGDDQITEWTEPDQPVDLTKDRRIQFGCYSISVNPVDGSIWCGGGGSRNRGNYLVRLERGADPPRSCKAEMYAPPAGVLGPGHMEVGTDGLVWAAWRGSDHITSFDRRECTVTNGPTTVDGEHCPEGWTLYSAPGPYFPGTTHGTDLLYLPAVDKFNTLGLGENVPIAGAINSGSLIALPAPDREWTMLRVPYPLGYFSRALHGRIDDPTAAWKGRGLWSAFSPYALWHVEGGKGTRSKLIKFQVRPDPLAK